MSHHHYHIKKYLKVITEVITFFFNKSHTIVFEKSTFIESVPQYGT